MVQKVFTLGHSPDPDDAFMFYAMAQHKIDLRGYEFEHILQDIQTLNDRATRGELDISAISIHAYSYVLDRYALLPCGASMGDNYGPLLVAKSSDGLKEGADDEAIIRWLKTKRIAIPGRLTSASLALALFAGDLDTRVIPFDRIFETVESGLADVGLIIHEGQLTYERDGFIKIRDLGEWWFTHTNGLPLPLGGNVIRKDLAPNVLQDLSAILKESISYGLKHREDGVKHSMPLARGLDEGMADRFIGMYVNDFTLDYGDRGREAIRCFLKEAHTKGLIPSPVELEFIH
jgi:1,4-dihydroxy-6-naphthoate synthase